MFLSECRKSSIRNLLITTAICGFLLLLAACGTSKQTHLDRGEEYLQKRKFHEAVMEFRAAAEIDKDSAEAHWGLARSYENLGKLFETIDELRRTVELNPEKIEAKAKLGNYYLLIEPPMIGETEKLLEEIFAQDANFIEGHILKASLFAAQGKPQEEVLQVLRQAIAINPKRTESYLSLARYFMKINLTDKAEEAIKTALGEGENKSLAHLEYGRFLSYAGRDQESETEFLKAIEIAPENVEAREAIAEFYAGTRQLEKAEAAYKDIIQIQDGSAESRIALADFYARTGREDDAINTFKAILEDAPETARARYRLSEIYLDRKQYDLVKAEIEKLLSVNDTDAEALLLRARVHLQENDSDAAVKDLEEILKKQPSHRDALFYMAQARLAAGQLDQARAFIGDLERYHPNFLRAKLLKIQLSFANGKTEDALRQSNELLEAIKTAYPNLDMTALDLEDMRIRAITSRGLAYLELGKLAEAKTDLQDVVNLSPKSSAALVNLAKAAIAEKDLTGALNLYDKATNLDGGNFDALSGSVGILTKQGSFDEARQKIVRAIEQNAGNGNVLAALHYLNADIFTAQKDSASAEAELKKAIEADENYLPAYSAYAAMLVGRNQTTEAIAQYKTIVGKKPSASVYVLLGILEEARNDFAEAEKHYRKSLEIAPDSPIAANNLAWLIAEHTNGNLDEALTLAQTAVNQNQRTAEFYDTLGWVYFKKGLYSPAVEQMKKAVALNEAEAQKTGGAVNEDLRKRLNAALAQTGGKSNAQNGVAQTYVKPAANL
jgi:tetratricopeptide (TPR) repeat protein